MLPAPQGRRGPDNQIGVKKLSAYLLYVCQGINDRSELEKYWGVTQPTFEGRNMKVHAAYTAFDVLEGDGPVLGVVIAEFPSYEVARDWYDSPEYVAARQHRMRGASYIGLLTEGGYTPPEDRMPETKPAQSELPVTPEPPEGPLRVAAQVDDSQPAYLMYLCLGVKNRAGLEKYWAEIGSTLAGTDAEMLVAYSPFELLEGDVDVIGVSLARFPSMTKAREWYHGPAYSAVRPYRTGSADYLGLLVQGGWLPPEKRMIGVGS
jgi:uncharacterized protein (DUF1330 family)